ncbi:MAG: hypothetical protein H7330_01900 [Hymenobacteraceae bacterium]|nr:hypothetical protein [Hymenobacteraceae bacterium]
MKMCFVLIGSTLAALLLGGWLPGGTYWLTPLASLVLVTLAFFGPQSPAVLLAVLDGEWRAIGRLAWVHLGARVFRLTLLALPVWLGQCGKLVGANLGADFTSQNIVVGRTSDAPPTRCSYRAFSSPIRVWAEAADTAQWYDSVRVIVETSAAHTSLPAQAHDPPLMGFSPAASIAWGWADLDLLPDLTITIAPVYRRPAATRTLFIPLTDTVIREQSLLAASVWEWWFVGYAWATLIGLALGALGWITIRLTGWTARGLVRNS